MGGRPEARLVVELVPSSSWYTNVRSSVPKSLWDKLRKSVFEKAGNRCEICGGVGKRHPVECHEVWEYDEPGRVQRLVRLIALCPACHEVKHFGRAESQGRGDKALRWLMRVNGWTRQEAVQHVQEAFRLWQQRSLLPWELDMTAIQ